MIQPTQPSQEGTPSENIPLTHYLYLYADRIYGDFPNEYEEEESNLAEEYLDRILGTIQGQEEEGEPEIIYTDSPSGFWSKLEPDDDYEYKDFFTPSDYDFFYRAVLYGLVSEGPPLGYEAVHQFEHITLTRDYKCVICYEDVFSTIECKVNPRDIKTGKGIVRVYERIWTVRAATEEEAEECDYYTPLRPEEVIYVGDDEYIPFSPKNWSKVFRSKFVGEIPEVEDKRYNLLISEFTTNEEIPVKYGYVNVVDKNSGLIIRRYVYTDVGDVSGGSSIRGVIDNNPYEYDSLENFKYYRGLDDKEETPLKVVKTTYSIEDGKPQEMPSTITKSLVLLEKYQGNGIPREFSGSMHLADDYEEI